MSVGRKTGRGGLDAGSEGTEDGRWAAGRMSKRMLVTIRPEEDAVQQMSEVSEVKTDGLLRT